MTLKLTVHDVRLIYILLQRSYRNEYELNAQAIQMPFSMASCIFASPVCNNHGYKNMFVKTYLKSSEVNGKEKEMVVEIK